MKIFVAHRDDYSSGLSEPLFVTQHIDEMNAYIMGAEDTYGSALKCFMLDGTTGEVEEYAYERSTDS